MLVFVLIPVIFILCGCKNINSIEFAIKVGDKIEACCTLKPTGKNTLVIWWGTSRLVTLNGGELTEGDLPVLATKYKDFKSIIRAETACLIKDQATTMDKDLELKCVVMKGSFGKSIESEMLYIKIFEELKFVVQPEDKKTVSSGDTVTMKCEASGNPDLKVIWRKEGNGVLVSGNESATLEITNATPKMNGDKYTCEASISFPKDSPSSVIKQTTTLYVLYEPKLQVDIMSFHTDLGIKEVVKIIIEGNPRPQLDCQLLNIAADRIITIGEQSPFIYMYNMEFDNVTKDHIGDYNCIATNSKGEVKKQISLKLGPDDLTIMSLNSTDYCNYYRLKWSVVSKAKLNTSKIFIDVYEDGVESDLKKTVLEGKELNPEMLSAGNEENRWRYQYSQHLMNLTNNKLNKISLQMCSRHHCIDAAYPVYVRTPTCDGKNTMLANQLQSSQNMGGNNGKSVMSVTSVSFLNVLVVTTASVILTELHLC